MRRLSVKNCVWWGVGSGLSAGLIAGVVSFLSDLAGPVSALTVGLVVGGNLFVTFGFAAGIAAHLYNVAAELVDPQIVPPDGPAADYHDITRRPS